MLDGNVEWTGATRTLFAPPVGLDVVGLFASAVVLGDGAGEVAGVGEDGGL